MNKKIILLPFLAVGLLAGCTGGKKTSSEAEKPIWEQPLVEGETSIDDVKASEEENTYFKVRGTVVFNAGSTLAIARGGKFLYCYNFNGDSEKSKNEDLKPHPLGSYVEIYAQMTKYQGSTQLTAYVNNAYDPDAKLTVLAEQGEKVDPVAVNTAEGFENVAAGTLAKIEYTADQDYTLASGAKIADGAITGLTDPSKVSSPLILLDSYNDPAVVTKLLEDNPKEIGEGDKVEMIGCLAATSKGSCRLVLGEGSSWKITQAKQWAEPTGVTVTAEGSATSVEVDGYVQLSAVVAPAGAKQKVTWKSSDETKATINADGKVKGVAEAASVTFTATAKEGVAETINLAVVPAAPKSYTKVVGFDFSGWHKAYQSSDGWTAGLSDANGTSAFTGGVEAIVITGTNCVTAATGSKWYEAADGQGCGTGLKLGTGSVEGYVQLTTNVQIAKVVLTIKAWSATKLATVKINDGEGVTLEADDATTARQIADTFAPTNTVKVSSSIYANIQTLELYSLDA